MQEMSEIDMSQATGNVKYSVLDTNVVLKPPGWEITKGNYGHMNTERVREGVHLPHFRASNGS